MAVIGAGALVGLLVVAGASGALTPIWTFFVDGLIEHFMAMQWTRFSCF